MYDIFLMWCRTITCDHMWSHVHDWSRSCPRLKMTKLWRSSMASHC